MLRFLKQVVWIVGLIFGSQSAFGFALLGPLPSGPPDSFEVPAIGYRLGTLGGGGILSTLAGYPGDDIGTPKNIDEEYRRNTPVLYYAFDSSFLNFFQERGAAEVDKAMAIFNSLTNVSSYSPDLSEFPLDSRRVNFRASAASLMDLRSVTMGFVTEQLGFWQPTRWVWALHARTHINGLPPCPGGMDYDITKRNFDINPTSGTVYQNSSYVNGVLYSYFIIEFCTGTIPLADAIEFPVDPLSVPFSAVADYSSFAYQGLLPGGFYTALTRDDVGALRYLIRTNNYNTEPAGGRVTEFLTNSQPEAITTLDLNLFATQARTNNAAALVALYPGLVINNTSNFFGLATVTNITLTLTNSPFDPAGTPPSHPSFSTNYTTNFVTFFQHTFGNVITNQFSTRGVVGTVSLGLTNSPFAPAGSPATVVTNPPRFVIANGIFGNFFLLPTNACGVTILSNLLTTVIATTNLPSATNTTATNSITFLPGSITFSTNQVVIFLSVTCTLDTVATREGIERIRFIRRDFDSLINQLWDPVTNDYTLVEITNNGSFIPRHMQRRVPKPDFLFTAADLAAAGGFSYSGTVDNLTETETVAIGGLGKFDAMRIMNFDNTQTPANNAGPGTITTPRALTTFIVFNKVGPLYNNSFLQFITNAPFFLTEQTQIPYFPISWGSFDGTTNTPIVYPNGVPVTELEQLLEGPFVNTRFVPDASIGAAYSSQLSASGGQLPYTWTLAPSSPALPSGLNLSTDGEISGTPDGPAAIYDFTVRVTDSVGAFKDSAFTIRIN